jgi:16S rRNA (adenine1518-N6/adenine1519-N6)-dimethyltransferase
LRGHVRDLHVMLQEEVAQRVASPPGSREYGILSVLYALWADVDIPLRFGPAAFQPPPRVSSAVLRGRFLAASRVEVQDLKAFESLVMAAFARRRRTLENNLQDSYANLKENLRLLNIEGSRRAETLSVVEFARLARALER